MILYRFKKRIKPIIFIVLGFSFLFVCPLSAQKDKNAKTELENKKKRINAEIREINLMLSETNAGKKLSMGALLNLNIRLQKRQELINTINAQLNQLNHEIRENESQAEQLKASLTKLKNEYARMIVYAQRNQDAYSALMFIFAAEDFNQAYARLKYMQQYSEFRRKQALEIINTQTQLIAKLNQLKAQKTEKNSLLKTEQTEKNNLSSEKAAKEQVLTELQKKEKELKKELEKKKEDAVQLQLAIKRIIAEEIRRKAEAAEKARKERLLADKKAKEAREAAEKKKRPADKTVAARSKEPVVTEEKKELYMPELNEEAEALSADFANNRGKLPWPVPKGVICEPYGEHEHPAIKGFKMFNNGVEICATKGTQARAVFEGEVTGIAVSPAGGNLVIIRHGEYLSVYSNIDQVLVKTGQKVSVKQVIGTVLYNEEEDKSSMNLQIWKGQKTMDPGGWLYNAR
jgi:murein hydrolase activator